MLKTLSMTLLATTVWPYLGCSRRHDQPLTSQAATYLLSAYDTTSGSHHICMTNLQGKTLFDLPVDQRAHGAVFSPEQSKAIFFSRRPGTKLYVVNCEPLVCKQGPCQTPPELQTIEAPEGYHFYGHGVFSQDGRWLFTSENLFDQHQGIIGIYDAHDQFKRVDQWHSGGIGPHELVRSYSGKFLVIANGGIQTHPASGRQKLNLDTMQPNLTYLDTATGFILDQFKPPDHQLSLRHLDINHKDQVIVGAQYQGPQSHIQPLVFSHQGQTQLQPMNAASHWPSLKQYIASVVISADGTQALTTTPRGGMVSRWALDNLNLIDATSIPDVAGAGYLGDTDPRHASTRQDFLVTNGLGQLITLNEGADAPKAVLTQPNTCWDNHVFVARERIVAGGLAL